MSVLPETTRINDLGVDSKKFYEEVILHFTKIKKADNQLSKILIEKLLLTGCTVESYSEIIFAELFAAKDTFVSMADTLRYVVISLVVVCAKKNDSSILEKVVNIIFFLLAQWFGIKDLGLLYKALMRGKGQSFRYLDRVGIKPFSDLRVKIDIAILEGSYNSIDSLPLPEIIKIEIFSNSRRRIYSKRFAYNFDSFYGYYVDYIMEGFWP